MPIRIALIALFAYSICLAISASPACADSVTLKQGGEIRGEVLGDSKAKGSGDLVSIRTLSGATVAVLRSEVNAIIRRRPIAEEYETRRRSVPETVEAHWDLAEWCRQKSLTKEREAELRRVIEFDPDHAAAHRALGHVQYKGNWATQDEAMTARGFVKHKGKYVPLQQLELIQQEERVSEAEKGWFKKVRMWHGWLEAGNPSARAKRLSQLRAIKEPDAVAALSKTFRASEVNEQRLLYVEILGKISGEKPLQPLIVQSLWDESREIRAAAIRGVRNRDIDKALQPYVKALKNGMNAIVNRAGDALGEIGNDSVVPPLIDALVTRHSYTIIVPDQSVGGFRADGGMTDPTQNVLPPSVAGQLATGQLPYGVQVNTPLAPPRTKEIPVERDEENPDVLNALTLLTGENFGFDEPAWRSWYNAQHNLKQFPKTGRKPRAKP